MVENESGVDDDTARGLVAAITYWPAWLHRRVESIELLEGDRARRRISLDLDVLDQPIYGRGSRGPGPELQVAVPIAILQKTRMRGFDATGPDGQPLPVLGREENGALGSAFLRMLLAAELDDPVTDETEELIGVLVTGEREAAAAAALMLQRIPGVAGTLSGYYIERLATGFILFVLLPREWVGRRVVVKFSYYWDTSALRPGETALRRTAAQVLGAVGLRPVRLQLELASMDQAGSYHLELAVPAGLTCTNLTLTEVGGAAATDDAPGSVAHVHGQMDVGAVRPSGVVSLDVQPSGLHRVVLLSALAVGGFFFCSRGHMAALTADASTPVSVILLGPALLLTFLARPGETSILSWLLAPLRLACALLAGALVTAALMLALGTSRQTLGWYWDTSACVSVAGAIVVLVGWCLISHRRRPSQAS